LTDLTTALSQVQPEMLERLRPLEGRLGLVLTLFKAAVWSYVKNEEVGVLLPGRRGLSGNVGPGGGGAGFE
jgi:hypothetical protein